ncbi:MAG TPA: response regulator transcription factor [Vicinamibacteria bacterium]|nr:response regulator transcription factor [Vicinamibacteria bacterium]
MTSILLVQHDAATDVALSQSLVEQGYRVETAAAGQSALSRGESGGFDLVILDVTQPRRSGLDACRELRRRGFTGPVILVNDRDEVADRVLALKLGADDCLTRPFDAAELLARIEACLRRGPALPTPTGVRQLGGIEVDLRGARVLRAGRPVAMSPQEFQLLRCLVEHEGTPLSRDQLLDRAWGRDAMPTARTVDVHVAGLRRKLETDPHRPTLIRTVHGVGYVFAGGDV